MTAWKSLLAIAAFVLSPVMASAQSAPPLGKPIFCNEEYALCIKAACEPIVGKNNEVKYANCACDVRQGWSMGPQSCERRHPIVKNGLKFLISTYSNLYNDRQKTLSCSSSTQLWAWCYGASCVVDRADPTKTTCTCPVYEGAMNTLGGGCSTGNCNNLWSGAAPKADVAANDIFAAYMKLHGYPHNPPAAMCQ